MSGVRRLHGLLRNSILSFLLNGSATAISFFAIPITLKIMGLAMYGSFVFVQASAAIMFTLCTLQYWQGLLVEFPGKENSSRVLARQVWRSLSYEGVGLLAALLLVLGLHLARVPQAAGLDQLDLLLIVLSTLLPTLGSIVAFYRLTDRYQVLLGAGLLCNLMRLGLLNVAQRYHPTVTAVILSYALPEVLRFGYLGLSLLYRRQDLPGPVSGGGIDRGRIVSAGKWSTVQAMADLPVANVDKILVGLALSPEALGIYNILKRLYSIINIATAPVYMNSIPEFARRINQADLGGAFTLWRNTIFTLLPLSAAVGLSCYALRGYWTGYIYHDLIHYSRELLIVIVTAVIAGGFITSHALYWALGKKRQSTAITVSSNLIYLVLLLALSARHGLAGAVAAFLLQVAGVVLVKVLLLIREKRRSA